MIYEMKKKSDIKHIQKYGKAYGVFLLNFLLPKICNINNFFIIDNVEDLKKIEKDLPEIVILRADAKAGESPTLGVRGKAAQKTDIAEYIDEVKAHNPYGVILCIDTDVENQNQSKSIDGSFNVYFEWGKKVYIDYLGKGFDVGGITKGEDNHEMWSIDWEDVLFVKPNDMNQYRTYLISDEEYKESAERKVKALMKSNKCSEDEARKKVFDKYHQMPLSIKEALLDQIVFEIYAKKEELNKLGLKSFGVQGMIRGGNLFPVEINRRERFVEKEDFEKYSNKKEER